MEVGSGKAFNHVTDLEEDVPQFDILVAGFSCKDVSSEQAKRTFSPASRSGGTFGGILRIMQRFGPKVVILENVIGLLKRIGKKDPPIKKVMQAPPSSSFLCRLRFIISKPPRKQGSSRWYPGVYFIMVSPRVHARVYPWCGAWADGSLPVSFRLV